MEHRHGKLGTLHYGIWYDSDPDVARCRKDANYSKIYIYDLSIRNTERALSAKVRGGHSKKSDTKNNNVASIRLRPEGKRR
jgi:hypothetical protein